VPHLGAPKEPCGDGRVHLRLPYAGYPRRAGILQARRGELQARGIGTLQGRGRHRTCTQPPKQVQRTSGSCCHSQCWCIGLRSAACIGR